MASRLSVHERSQGELSAYGQAHLPGASLENFWRWSRYHSRISLLKSHFKCGHATMLKAAKSPDRDEWVAKGSRKRQPRSRQGSGSGNEIISEGTQSSQPLLVLHQRSLRHVTHSEKGSSACIAIILYLLISVRNGQ